MNRDISLGGAGSPALAAEQQKVLRNTMFMLALSMVPTVIGAGLGVALKFQGFGPWWLNLVLFLGISFGFFYAIEKTKESMVGFVLLLGFTLFMGFWLSRMLQVALGFSNGGTMIAMAGGGTALIFGALATFVTVTRKDFSFMGNFLFVGMIVLFLAAIAAIVFQMPLVSVAISAGFVLLFSGYILYDMSQIIHGGETSYISATLSLYLDIYNIFVSLLHIIMALTGERD